MICTNQMYFQGDNDSYNRNLILLVCIAFEPYLHKQILTSNRYTTLHTNLSQFQVEVIVLEFGALS